MIEVIWKEWQAKVALALFCFFTIWWICNHFIFDPSTVRYDKFGDIAELYGLMAVWGGFWGFKISKKWGFTKSIVGKSLIMFSLGLFFQEFGQLSYALYYDLFGTPGPYPSLGDAGFFGSIPLYIFGVYYLAKASGVKVGIHEIKNKIQAVIIPLFVLIFDYWFFLKNYTFDFSNPIKVFLDFGYPLGQALYVSFAFLTYLLTRKVLGGIMKKKVLLILFALILQFASDYTFLYQSNNGLWQVGGINDYMYFVSYFVMTLALLQFGTALKTVKEKLS